MSKRYWIGVASREHVLIGRESGFAQFCHGKEAPAKRPRQGDWVIYYSGKEKFEETAPCQKFTAKSLFVLKVEKHAILGYGFSLRIF